MLEKRVKRHIIGQSHPFFAAAAPGLEELCAAHLRSAGIESARAEPGGAAFEGKLTDLYAACLLSPLANRVLMRVLRFKATHFRALEKSVSQAPWELYLPASAPLAARAALHHSRLYHSTAVEEAVLKAIAQRMETQEETFAPPGLAPRPQEIFVRAMDDQFILSLDATGDLLFKRGFKGLKAAAPLRETLAAAVLMLTGYDGAAPLLDPMCGSGAFATEAALMACNIPPGWSRDFAFFSWPGFREGPWADLRRKCQAEIREVDRPCIFASDIDPGACQRLQDQVNAQGWQAMVQVSQGDILELAPPPEAEKPGLIVINPPYGVRLENKADAENLFRNLCTRLSLAFPGWKAALLIPDKSWLNHARFAGNPALHPLRHGGLRLTLAVGIL